MEIELCVIVTALQAVAVKVLLIGLSGDIAQGGTLTVIMVLDEHLVAVKVTA